MRWIKDVYTRLYSQVYIHEIAINLARSHPPQRTMGAPAPFDSSAISNTVVRTVHPTTSISVLGTFLYYVSDTFRDRLSLN